MESIHQIPRCFFNRITVSSGHKLSTKTYKKIESEIQRLEGVILQSTLLDRE